MAMPHKKDLRDQIPKTRVWLPKVMPRAKNKNE